jgi:hypothetical protein
MRTLTRKNNCDIFAGVTKKVNAFAFMNIMFETLQLSNCKQAAIPTPDIEQEKQKRKYGKTQVLRLSCRIKIPKSEPNKGEHAVI